MKKLLIAFSTILMIQFTPTSIQVDIPMSLKTPSYAKWGQLAMKKSSQPIPERSHY